MPEPEQVLELLLDAEPVCPAGACSGIQGLPSLDGEKGPLRWGGGRWLPVLYHWRLATSRCSWVLVPGKARWNCSY